MAGTTPSPLRIILRNTAFITAGVILLKGLNFLFAVLIIRTLKDEGYGQYSIVLGFAGLFSVFLELGMTQYVSREIARDRTQAEHWVWDLVVLRLMFAAVGVLVIPLVAFFSGYKSFLVWGILLHTFSFLLAAFYAPLEAVLTANEKLSFVTGLTLLARASFILLGALALWFGFGVLGLIAAGLISMLPQIGLALWVVKHERLIQIRPKFRPAMWPDLIRGGVPFGLTSLALTVAFSIDTVMLSWSQPERVVGWYNIAYNLVFSLESLFGAFAIALVPTLTRVYRDDPAYVSQWFYRATRLILVLTFPMAVGGALLAFPIIEWLYSPDLRPAAFALQILIWDLPFLMFAAFCGNLTTTVGLERHAARIYTLNAVANVLLNLYAIPQYGLVGAALVTVITDWLGALQFYVLLRHHLRVTITGLFLVRVLLACVGMGLGIWFLAGLPWLLLVLIGAGVYIGLVVLLQVLEVSEWLAFRQLLGRAKQSLTQRFS